MSGSKILVCFRINWKGLFKHRFLREGQERDPRICISRKLLDAAAAADTVIELLD